MKVKRVALIVVAAVVVGGTAVGVYFAANPGAAQSEAGDLPASGFIEAEEIAIAPELGGRVVEVLVEEGEEVEAGQVLVRLDGTLLEAQVEVAQAAVDAARAGLAQAQAGARPEQIQQAEAALAQAEAARDGAYQAWQDAIAICDNPQELDAQIALAKAQVAATEAALEQAVYMKDVATMAKNSFEGIEGMLPARMLPVEGRALLYRWWQAWAGVNSAGAAYDGAVSALNYLYAMRANPQELNAQVDAAEAHYRAADAAAQMAGAQLDGLRAGATAEEIAAAEAQVDQAQAALDALLVLRDKLTISTPVGGLVLESSIHEGELAAPGATLLTLGDLDEVTLTVYVPEDRLGQVHIGQQVEVYIDSFPGQMFTGTVVAIAHEAEFTPRNVQTQEERVNMVFAVDVRIPNPDHALKPGLPADAVIVVEEQ